MAFSVTILINAIDVSAKIVGNVIIKAAESEARTADFSINPSNGNINPYSYVGKTVTIDYTDGTSNRIFTGIIHLPVYNIKTGLLSFICTDTLQESVELISRTAVDTLLPYHWDTAVFNDPEENWTYAQQKLSTYPGSFDKDASGNLRVTDWQAKTTPDYTYTDSTIIDDSLSVSLAERRSITNSIKINISNRYQRQWQRELTGEWHLGFLLGPDYFANPNKLPTKSMIEMAASAWTIKNIAYTTVPQNGIINDVQWIPSEYTATQVTDAVIDVAKRWVQNITDNYSINISNAASITQHGLLEIEQKHIMQSEADSTFTDFAEYKTPTGNLIEPGNYINLTAKSPSNAINTAMNMAKTKILESHRNNKVTFSTVLNSNIDTDKTIRVNHTKIQATGKVFELQHNIDLENGTAITSCTLAVYMPNIAGQTDNALTVPASPHTNPTGLPNTLPAMTTHLGNIIGAVAEDPNWNGFVSNYFSWGGFTTDTPIWYKTEKFSIEIPAISETNALEFNAVSTINIAIPQNEMVIIK